MNTQKFIIIVIFMALHCGGEPDVRKFQKNINDSSGEMRDTTRNNPSGNPPNEKTDKTIVFSTPFPENLYFSKTYRNLYGEAFRRLGYKFRLVNYPVERSLVEADSGDIDGDASRIYELNSANRYPNLIRVEEPDLKQRTCLYSARAGTGICRWDDFRGKGYNIGYMRGNKSVEIKLPKLEGNKIIDVTKPGQLMEMLRTGRIDFFIAPDDIENLFPAGETAAPSIKRICCLEEVDLYAYVNKKHKKIARDLALTLRSMKNEGIFQKIISGSK